jgi:hypothetical protein
MSVMRAPEAWADDRVFTVEDLEDMPDDGQSRHRQAVPHHDRAGRPCDNGFRVTPEGAGRA